MSSSRNRILLVASFAWLFASATLAADEPAHTQPIPNQPAPSQSPPADPVLAETVPAAPPQAATAAAASRPLLNYRSSRLHVRTDLAQVQADALFARLEKTLRFAARYWGREPRGQIKCYVVDDLNNWSDTELPHRLARIIIHGVGGATVPNMVSNGKRSRNEPAVFASSHPGVAEHEVIHAYCAQTFGSGGPEWYKEGMAEMASRGCTRLAGIQCSVEQFASLRHGKRTTVSEILSVGSTGLRLWSDLQTMMRDPAHDGRHVSLAAWTQHNSENVAQARDEYLRSWAFCYMLLHNPNYSKRFRAVGGLMVTKQHGAFDSFFEPVRQEIAFEYNFLLDHLTAGYRVDLCRWDWQTRFRPLQRGISYTTRVAAARGFQASGVEVVAGQHYACQSDGHWQMAAEGERTDANGSAGDSGRLVGVVMSAFELGKPFLLGTESRFKASTNGHLYLRCNDGWNQLADNRGQITVKFSVP